MNTAVNPLAARFSDGPTLIAPEQKRRFEACVAGAASELAVVQAREAAERPLMSDDFWPDPNSWMSRYRPYVVVDGVLQIPVKGVLLHDFPLALGSWATGYDYIWRAFKRGLEDANVRGIALVIDSPGGMVAGCFEMVDRMVARRGEKPVRAFAAEHAYSAAFATACVADKITMTRTGGVGSVGVVTTHIDWSKWNENYGLNFTYIFAGKHKVDGNPDEPLSEEVKARIQARIDALYDVFVASVAKNRGLEEAAVRATEALTYAAAEAQSVGFADDVGALDDALADFSATLISEGDTAMAEAQANTNTHTQADVDAALARGRTEGASTERTRIAAVLTCENAQGREAAAIELALDEETAFTASTANKVLAKLPKGAAEQQPAGQGRSPFETAMEQSGNPGVGAGGAGGEEGSANDPRALRALAASVGLKGYAKAS